MILTIKVDMMEIKSEKKYDVIIIGGGYSGLSAALALGRSLRSVLIIDAGEPCNKQTPHSHNFLTQDGNTPSEILRIAKEQLKKYATIEFYNGFASQGKKINSGFEIKTSSQDLFYSKKIIFASGIKDIKPDIKGFKDCWAISVIHCPYCHGYEFKEQRTAIYTNNVQSAMHMVALVHNLTKKLTIIANDNFKLEEEQLKKLDSQKIEVINSNIVEINHDKGYLNKVVLENGKILELDAIYASLPFEQHSNIPFQINCLHNEDGFITVDEFQKTTIDGAYACGDNTTRMRSVANAVFTGNLAGVMVNMDLANKEF